MFGFFRKTEPTADPVLHAMGSESELKAAFERCANDPVLLFKHSRTCGTSFFARKEVQQLSEADDPRVYEIVVQDARSLSNEIAARFGIRHESPQAILIRNGKAVWNTSHGRITSTSVRNAVRESA